jgi:hypothetical protein
MEKAFRDVSLKFKRQVKGGQRTGEGGRKEGKHEGRRK